MSVSRFLKLIALVRFSLLKFFFKKSGNINFIYSNTTIRGYNRISIGKLNIFKENSNITIDSYGDKQYLSLGNKNVISSYSILKSHGGYITIGDDNFIGERTQIQGYGGVEIGNNCMIAANVFVSSSNHKIDNPNSKDYLIGEIGKKVIIEDYVWIGANCTITAGVTISHHSVIAAGSTVTKNIDSYLMAAGSPAKPIKYFNFELNKWSKFE